MKIFIDPGHGGPNPGAVANGVTEEYVNLNVSLELARLLREAGFDVMIYRTTQNENVLPERNADLRNRAAMANSWGANYIISGYGKEGTAVTLYWHDATANLYRKIYNETQYVDANGARQSAYTEATVTIGASGQFMNTVNLAQGGNNILVRAENGGQTQLLRLSVTKYNYNLFDIIKSLTK